jgi:hypothetical protein
MAALTVMTTVGAGSIAAASQAPSPAGSRPAAIVKMVCSSEAVGKIDEILGEPAKVSDPTWVNHLYSCDYAFGGATMVLSVKELSSWSQTIGYFRSLETPLKKKMTLYGLGQGAFNTRVGSVVVRKDWKVLVVDVAALPKSLAATSTASNIGLSVAGAIMLCWKGD